MDSQQESNSHTLGSRDAIERMWESNFEKLINSNRKWRKICERLVARGVLEDFSYSQCCKIVSQAAQWMKSNWQSGTCTISKKSICPLIVENDKFTDVDDNLLLMKSDRCAITTVDRSDMSLKRVIPIDEDVRCVRIFQNFIFCGQNGKIVVFDGQNGSKICELTNNSGLIEEISFTGNRLVAFSCNQTIPQLDVWQRNDNGTFSFIRRKQFAIFRGMWRSVEMDDRYAAIAISRDNVKTELYFVSMETMKIERSFMFNGSYRYDSGLVFVADGNVLWIFDVVDEELLGKLNDKISDTRIRTNELPIRMNSDWLVMLTNEENNPIFAIYKLEDVRNPSIDVIAPTIKLKLPCLDLFYFFVDETEIIFVDKTGQIQVIDFFESHLHELN